MTNVADVAPVSGQTQPTGRAPRSAACSPRRRSISACSACSSPSALILLTFNILSGGKFFQPTNMITMAVQAAGVAIIATGMVLVIVSRNIDLSVGSLVGIIAMTYALLMTDWLPNILGHRCRLPVPLGHRPRPSASASGRASARSRASSSPTSACRPSSSRSAGCCRSAASSGTSRSGAAVSGLDPNFQLIGGGAQGSLGGTLTWVLGVVGCIAIIGLLINSRRQRRRYGFPLRPMWAEVLLGVVGCAAVLGLACVRQQQLLAGGPRRPVRGRATASDRRPAACRSRPASRSRSSCSSA